MALFVTPAHRPDLSINDSRSSILYYTVTARANPRIQFPSSRVSRVLGPSIQELLDLLASLFDGFDAQKAILDLYRSLKLQQHQRIHKDKVEKEFQDVYASFAPYVNFVQD